MTVLLDAYALIAFVGNGPGGDQVATLLRAGDGAVTPVNLAEAVDVLARRFDVAADRSRAVLEPLFDAGLALAPLGPAEAWRAGELRAAHYHRERAPLSMADCLLLASAAKGASIATADRPLAAVAERLGTRVVELPGEGGR